MGWARVEPVIDLSMRGICVQPYPGHKKGCPNWNKKDGCPPIAPKLTDILRLNEPVFAVWNIFDLEAHVAKMRAKHPDYSWRQLVNCLYWQGTARKRLKQEMVIFWDYAWREVGSPAVEIQCPEARGVNVTETMKSIGHELEWPPKTITYQVALIGTGKISAAKEPA